MCFKENDEPLLVPSPLLVCLLYLGLVVLPSDVMGRSYQIALLQLHELIDAHVFPYIVVVCEDAFAIHCALAYVSIELNLTVTEGRDIPPSSILQPLWRVYRWDVFDRASRVVLSISLVYYVLECYRNQSLQDM